MAEDTPLHGNTTVLEEGRRLLRVFIQIEDASARAEIIMLAERRLAEADSGLERRPPFSPPN